MVSLYTTGRKTMEEIGAMYGLTRERVRQLIKRHGVTKVNSGRRMRVTEEKFDKAHKTREKRERFFQVKWGMSESDFLRLNDDRLINGYGSKSMAFKEQRRNARLRGLEFTLTFEQWVGIWNDSGKWHKRGVGKGKYSMGRRNDSGGYTLGNVFIVGNEQNAADYQAELKLRGVQCPDGWKRLPENPTTEQQMEVI
jgi:hypothetical protein